MNHLTPSEFVEQLDGQLDTVRRAHLDACARCQADAAALRETLASTRDDAPEPSPLFWTQFEHQVRERLSAEPAMPWWRAWLQTPARAVLTAAAALALIVAGGKAFWPASTSTIVAPPSSTHSTPDDADLEEAWAAVRAAAESAGPEAIQEAGVSTRPGQADGELLRLNDAERRQLMLLLEEELKRAGA